MWPFDRKKQPAPATFSAEALAKFRTYIPPALPNDYKPAKDLVILPILPPTSDQQHIRDELQAAVQRIKPLRPRQKGSRDFPAFEAELHVFGAHLNAAEAAMSKLEESGKQAEIEPGATLIYFLLALYCTRIAFFEQTGQCETPYSEDENVLLSGILDPLDKDPMIAANAAQVAGVQLDLVANRYWLTPLPTDWDDAPAHLLMQLWDLCIHPDLQLPSKD